MTIRIQITGKNGRPVFDLRANLVQLALAVGTTFAIWRIISDRLN